MTDNLRSYGGVRDASTLARVGEGHLKRHGGTEDGLRVEAEGLSDGFDVG